MTVEQQTARAFLAVKRVVECTHGGLTVDEPGKLSGGTTARAYVCTIHRAFDFPLQAVRDLLAADEGYDQYIFMCWSEKRVDTIYVKSNGCVFRSSLGICARMENA